jgi:hypothetical protein
MLFQTKNITLAHTFWGKLNSFMQAIMFFAVIFDFYPNIFFGAVTISLALAFINYTYRGLVILNLLKLQ